MRKFTPDQFIDLTRVRDEAAALRKQLDAGEVQCGPAYAAYNALLFVLGYNVTPPSQNWK
jgi:hypothetical protein